jgi:hypothetical protein
MMNNWPPMLCPTCGVGAVPRLAHGTGSPLAKAVGSACFGLLPWLPRALVEPVSTINQQQGRPPMLHTYARVGHLERAAHVRSHPDTGHPGVSVTGRVEESGKTAAPSRPLFLWSATAAALPEPRR